jgi:dolichol-phosphate mannosyltransferase
VIPALNEPGSIVSILERVDELLDFSFELLIVVDNLNDETISHLHNLKLVNGEIKVLLNLDKPGFSSAVEFGLRSASSPVIVVSMADGSDDPNTIVDLVRLVERGVTVAGASRYMAGGQQVGAPRLKGFLSKLAGKTFRFLTKVGTRDCTNNFKAYSSQFIADIEIKSTTGFEIGMELIAKAHRMNLLIAEIPTIWVERSFGKSNFLVKKQLVAYLKWYLYGIGINRNDR